MLNAVTSTTAVRCAAHFNTDAASSQHIADTLRLLNDALATQRRVLHTGDVVHQGGEHFSCHYM